MSTHYNHIVFQSSDWGNDRVFIAARDKFYPDTVDSNLFAVEYQDNRGYKIYRDENLTLAQAWETVTNWISTELFEV